MMNYFFLIGKLDSVNTFEDVLSGSAVRRTFKPVIVWWQHFKQKLFGENDFLKLMKAVQWKPIDLTYKVEEFTEFSWRNFFLVRRVQPEPQDGDEDDFWDPKSYNPLDKGPEMTAEQLKAWDLENFSGSRLEYEKAQIAYVMRKSNFRPTVMNAKFNDIVS